jgi:hypothetical protein
VKADTTQLLLLEINFSNWTVRCACRLVCETINQLRAPIAAANLAYVLSHYWMQCCGDKTHSKVTVTDDLFAFTASHDALCNSKTASFSFLAHVASSLPPLQFDHLHACKATVIEGIYTIADYLRTFNHVQQPAYNSIVATVSPVALHYVAHNLLSIAPSASMGASNLAIVNATCHSQVEGYHFTGQTITANLNAFLLGRVGSNYPFEVSEKGHKGKLDVRSMVSSAPDLNTTLKRMASTLAPAMPSPVRLAAVLPSDASLSASWHNAQDADMLSDYTDKFDCGCGSTEAIHMAATLHLMDGTFRVMPRNNGGAVPTADRKGSFNFSRDNLDVFNERMATIGSYRDQRPYFNAFCTKKFFVNHWKPKSAALALVPS